MQPYKHIKNFIEKETAHFLYEYLEFSTKVYITEGDPQAKTGDEMVPGCLGPRSGDLTFDAFLNFMHKKVEGITGLTLFPTYTYARLYTSGNAMPKHRDRPACEYSLTVKLSDNKKGNWPIVIEDQEVFLEDGDAVLYKGCEVMHWRNKCEIEDYKLGQVFLHYVDANGPYANERYDGYYDKGIFFEKDLKEFL
tara:strand:- start:149 stop:730 length:582 start_codon:yes stop_codon:yes gene_type:complete